MDAFVSRKRRRISEPPEEPPKPPPPVTNDEDESTDFKLAILASLHPKFDEGTLLEALLASDGSVERATETLSGLVVSPRKKMAMGLGYQSSLSAFRKDPITDIGGIRKRPLTKKGQTLHLYSPEDIEAHTPCTMIHNFLPAEEANALLHELAGEAPTFWTETFQMFERVVTSPHTFCFYVHSLDEAREQAEYVYNGSKLRNIRTATPHMLSISPKIEAAVNAATERRISDFYPGGKKLKYQSSRPWKPNTAFVNCYDGPQQSVGYHSDQLTYLGPRAIIGSLSLGVAREFRIRKVVAKDEGSLPDDIEPPKEAGEEKKQRLNDSIANAQGQISIHLPHNSLLIMHAEMQEEWKHSIAPARSVEPHPIAQNKRFNITYRHYKESLHPRFTPKCKCGIPTVLRCVQRKKENKGRYMWMCHAGYTPGKEGCGFFQWAEFDEDGEPPWAKKIADSREEDAQVKDDPL